MKSSCIEHPKREILLVIRQWQVEFCNGNACAAALLSYFEYWHNIKLDQRDKASQSNEVAARHGDQRTQDETLWQFHTEEDLELGILIYKRKTIRDAISYLIGFRFEGKPVIEVAKNPNPKYKFDRTKFFLFHPEVVSRWLDGRSGKMSLSKGKNTSRSGDFASPSGKTASTITETSSETSDLEVEPLSDDLFSLEAEQVESKPPIEEVFSYYMEKLGKHPKLYTLTEKRKKMGLDRWKEACQKTNGDREKAKFLMEAAIDALAADDFYNARGKHEGKTKFNDWEIIFRSTEQFEKFLERSNG